MDSPTRYDGSDGNAATKGGKAAFRKIRCPKCGRRLQLMTVDIENGYGDFWPLIPPHKIRKLKAKLKKKKVSRGSKKKK